MIGINATPGRKFGQPVPKIPSTRSIASGYSRRLRQPVPGKITRSTGNSRLNQTRRLQPVLRLERKSRNIGLRLTAYPSYRINVWRRRTPRRHFEPCCRMTSVVTERAISAIDFPTPFRLFYRENLWNRLFSCFSETGCKLIGATATYARRPWCARSCAWIIRLGPRYILHGVACPRHIRFARAIRIQGWARRSNESRFESVPFPLLPSMI